MCYFFCECPDVTPDRKDAARKSFQVHVLCMQMERFKIHKKIKRDEANGGEAVKKRSESREEMRAERMGGGRVSPVCSLRHRHPYPPTTLSPRLSLWITHPESHFVDFMFPICCNICRALVAELHLWACSVWMWGVDSWSEMLQYLFIHLFIHWLLHPGTQKSFSVVLKLDKFAQSATLYAGANCHRFSVCLTTACWNSWTKENRTSILCIIRAATRTVVHHWRNVWSHNTTKHGLAGSRLEYFTSSSSGERGDSTQKRAGGLTWQLEWLQVSSLEIRLVHLFSLAVGSKSNMFSNFQKALLTSNSNKRHRGGGAVGFRQWLLLLIRLAWMLICCQVYQHWMFLFCVWLN